MTRLETEISIPDSVARRFETCRKAGLKPRELRDILKLKDDYGNGAGHIYSIWLREKEFEKNMVVDMLRSDVSDYIHELMPGKPFQEAVKQVEVPLRMLSENRMQYGGRLHYRNTDELLCAFWQRYGTGLKVKEGGEQ
ncbi:MAG: hypothetical protein IJQ83_07370 [Bacteroidales bacterium]|nr:hypothetical protein [Bacteroidales bacterium]